MFFSKSFQVQSYVQLLWQQIDENKENVYNGAAEGVVDLTLCKTTEGEQ